MERPLVPGDLDEPALKERIAAELTAVRGRSFALTTDVLAEPELVAQHSALMSPLVWDLAHVGNYEELWLLRAAAGGEAIRPEIDDLYNAFEHPRAERPSLPLLDPDEARRYIAEVRGKALDALEGVRFTPDRPLLAGGFVYGMVVQHEHQHDETMLATHQLRTGAAALADPVGPAPPRADLATLPRRVRVEGGPFTMGTSTDPWAYDNERPAHTVEVPAFEIDTVPVSNADYLTFMESGGYDRRAMWTAGGWDWRCRAGHRAPGSWRRESGQWLRRRFGHVEPVPMDEPVQHVCWYEADAYARWAGARLPTEAEWEKAAVWDPAARRARRYPWGEESDPGRANLGQCRHRPAPVGSFPAGASPCGALQMLGDVWEWTSGDFHGYPGFRSFPYREYSEVFFGPKYKVLRGGSWAVDPVAARGTFRNWDLPERRQIFTGLRLAHDVAAR